MSSLSKLIETIVEQEIQKTKSGDEITFKVKENSEQINRGWVVHKITAFVNGEEAGFIKVSYIPSENMEKVFPTLWDYLGGLRGYYEYKDLHSKSLHDQITSLLRYSYDRHPLDDMTDDQLEELRDELLHNAHRKFGREFEAFKDFHQDKPLVDFIEVHEDKKRQRVGTGLYIAAAQWLAKKGMKLYASGLQSNDAAAAWAFLRKHLPDKIGVYKSKLNKPRTYLDFS